MQKRYLLAPGPTAIPPEVLLKMAEPIIHHRNPMFEAVVEEVRENLKYLFGTKNEVLIFASSGTGAMEGAVTNMLSPGDKAICVRSGKFGERWANICKAYGVETINIDLPWGDSLDPALVEKTLKENPGVKAVYMQATETSTGVRFPVKEVAAIVKNYPETILVVDGITGVGVFELPMDEWGIDVLVGGSQKALMLPPGLAFAGVSDKAWEFNKTSKIPRFYFNWQKELTNLQKNQTNFTPAISLIIGLRESLRMIKEEGLENIYKKFDVLANATREAAKALGLKIFAKTPSPAVTAIVAPEGIDGQAIYKSMWKKYGVTGAGGQDQLKGKIFRIATLGYADKYDVITAIAALEFTLRDLGYKFQMGTGVAKAIDCLKDI
ncbi:MAG TPA: alanine--glyoxylate aminotransferase family protein [Syntrophorhabdaceae bacterium]|nr:alanine--glyoxylate aminotransferase family protein [Syntrophorhabdaceae bacterium]HOT42888.1 alanine--glyoxylate aminotransferase family protein [Syntrophorhabdaceae bacterium]HPC67600.1 alanine--glyoxylate aminotransferase family protein [Syntrophorhabdaceae bacterium]HQE80966.1 alanine--glyoxylate aminotransferase family protein [Syntrophorhabdaceae bacterium]HQH44113.1 alanine--glyoxylate aminotransferase family protein [Syntrophorhabdaceae bacterium]